jgi:hypothetical protein
MAFSNTFLDIVPERSRSVNRQNADAGGMWCSCARCSDTCDRVTAGLAGAALFQRHLPSFGPSAGPDRTVRLWCWRNIWILTSWFCSLVASRDSSHHHPRLSHQMRAPHQEYMAGQEQDLANRFFYPNNAQSQALEKYLRQCNSRYHVSLG